jgi:hypothetical protein
MTLLADLLISTTLITLQPSQEPSAIAEVVMVNEMSNGSSDDGRYSLSIEGLTVDLVFTWDAGPFGADRVQVEPPRGIVCEPRDCILTVGEGHTAKVVLYWVLG